MGNQYYFIIEHPVRIERVIEELRNEFKVEKIASEDRMIVLVEQKEEGAETCAYDREHKVLANHECCECGKSLCSGCGYVDPPYSIEEIKTRIYAKHKHYCNECFEKRPKV